MGELLEPIPVSPLVGVPYMISSSLSWPGELKAVSKLPNGAHSCWNVVYIQDTLDLLHDAFVSLKCS